MPNGVTYNLGRKCELNVAGRARMMQRGAGEEHEEVLVFGMVMV